MRRLPAPTAIGSVCLAALLTVTLVWLGIDNGGFFPPPWGWAAIVLGWAAVVFLLMVTEPRIGTPQLVFLGGFVLYAAWSAVSLLWTSDVTFGMQSLERDLVYIAAALAAVAFPPASAAEGLRWSVTVGATALCVYSLACRLLPDHLGLYDSPLGPGRLYNPLGYWNAQGLLAAIAVILLLGVIVYDRAPVIRMTAASMLPLVVADCYFTLSRGALAAVGVGVAVWLVADSERVRASAWILATSLPAAAGAGIAHAYPTLTGPAYGLSSASAGHRLAAELAALSILSGLAVLGLNAVESKHTQLRRWRSRYIWSCGLALAAGVLFLFFTYGSPRQIGDRIASGLNGAPPTTNSAARLGSLSLNWRADLWRVAVHDTVDHPLVGSGSGSYEQRWLLARPVAQDSKWAHSLYLETAAELGLVGLTLIVVGLLVPVVVGWRSRADSMVPVLLGAYVAFLIHAAVDWDWQVPALTLAALWCGWAVVVRGRPFGTHVRLWQASAVALAAVTVAVAALGLVGNRDIALAHDALASGNVKAGAADARAAMRWEPWSYLPWMALGQARQEAGDRASAQAAYERAARADPGRWDAWFALAQVSRGSEAKIALGRARALNPLSTQIAGYCTATRLSGC